MNACSSSKSAFVRARDQAWVPGSMHTPRKVIGYRIGGPLAARRERRPVIEIDERQLAVGRHDHVASVDVETRGGRGARGQTRQRGRLEHVAARVSGIEPVEELVASHAVKLDL